MRAFNHLSKAGALLLCVLGATHGVSSAMSDAEPPKQPKGDLSNEQTNGNAYVDVKLAMDYAGFTAGETTLIGLTFFIKDGWHTYWPGLSDTGFGVMLNTKAPEGITVGEPIWPTPHRYLLPGDILDHVYEHEFTVLIPMTLDEGVEPGTPMTITTDISYLVCKEMCLPGSVSIEFGGYALDPELDRPEATGGHHDRLQALYKNRALPLKTERPDARVMIGEDRATIFVPGAKKLMFYPSQSCVDLPSLLADGESDSDTLTLHTEPTAGDMLDGRLEIIDEMGASRSYTLRVSAMAE